MRRLYSQRSDNDFHIVHWHERQPPHFSEPATPGLTPVEPSRTMRPHGRKLSGDCGQGGDVTEPNEFDEFRQRRELQERQERRRRIAIRVIQGPLTLLVLAAIAVLVLKMIFF